MFNKLGSIDEEVMSSMQKNISGQKETENADKLEIALNLLKDAADIFDRNGFQNQANDITSILFKFAQAASISDPDDYEACSACGFDHEYEPNESAQWHISNPCSYCDYQEGLHDHDCPVAPFLKEHPSKE
jgi:hypothetical protein